MSDAMSDARRKNFRLKAHEIKPLVTGRGYCFASDMITVDGRRVGFMYRENPDERGDSGWRFMAGYESPDYMDGADNIGLYDVNTIANYDQEIIPFLDAPVGSTFERSGKDGAFMEIHDFEPSEE